MVMTLMSNPKASVATIIVAADGTGDTTDIQTGINLLPATGGCVYIKEGTYTITNTIDITSDNVSLIGCGRSTQIQTTSNIRMLYCRQTAIAPVGGILIENLYFYGAGGGNAANVGIFMVAYNSFISHCWVENCGAEGVYWGAVNANNILANNYVLECIGSGIRCEGYSSLVFGNYCLENGDNGIDIRGNDIKI
ncbi:unnamed protein product, partial [marine sediment metagenome]